jgi:predicted DNA-binding transcriptional regulator AlpA
MPLRLIKLPECLRITGESRSGWYRGMDKGKYPLPIQRGRTNLWIESEVVAVIEAEIQAVRQLQLPVAQRKAAAAPVTE